MNKLIYWLNRFTIKFSKDYRKCNGECDKCSVNKKCKQIDDYKLKYTHQ